MQKLKKSQRLKFNICRCRSVLVPKCPGAFGTGAEVSNGQFGTSAEVSWCRSVPVPKCP